VQECGGKRRRHTRTVILNAQSLAACDLTQADVDMATGELRVVDGFCRIPHQVGCNTLQRLGRHLNGRQVACDL
jgi:hypothetical protein